MRFLALILLFVTQVFSYDIPLKQGWNLVGNGQKPLALKAFPPTGVDTVWRYDDAWSVYSPSHKYSEDFLKNYYSVNNTNINEYEGFWVYANEQSSLSVDATSNTQNSDAKVVVLDFASELDTKSKAYKDFTYNYSKFGGVLLSDKIDWSKATEINSSINLDGTLKKSLDSIPLLSTNGRLLLTAKKLKCSTSITLAITQYTSKGSIPAIAKINALGYEPILSLSADISVKTSDTTRVDLSLLDTLCTREALKISDANGSVIEDGLEIFYIDGYDTVTQKDFNGSLEKLQPFVVAKQKKREVLRKPVELLKPQTVDTIGAISDIVVDKKDVYVADKLNALHILHYENNTTNTEKVELIGMPVALKISNDIVAIGFDTGYVKLYDKNNMGMYSSIYLGSAAKDIVIKFPYIFVSQSIEGIKVLKIDSDFKLKLIDSFGSTSDLTHMALDADMEKLFVVDHNKGVDIYDITQIDAIKLSDTLSIPQVKDIAIVDDLLYVAADNFYIYKNRNLLASYSLLGNIQTVKIDKLNHIAYVLNSMNQIVLVDLTNHKKMKSLGSLSVPYGAQYNFLNDNFFVTNQDGGMKIYKVSQ